MSGFSTEWLALREPVDHRSRAPGLPLRLARALGQRAGGADRPLRILDLGCGSGSNLRALAPLLPGPQHWVLVDHDPELLRAARQTILSWADAAEADGATLIAVKGGRRIHIEFRECDLANDVEPLLATAPDLVTAAALFDLVSAQWIRSFAERLSSVFYTVLTYSGTEVWEPVHAADAKVLDAFHAHQTTDKGFGIAAGPGATDVLRECLERRGFDVTVAESPWILGQDDAALMRALSEGSAGAVAETGLVEAEVLASWLQARRGATRCEIGHWDLLAIPPGLPAA